ncbi:UNVERIFIED_CONTAM: hypothetical protein HDU68_001913, partial [Siphonaria sp. JEL0065]
MATDQPLQQNALLALWARCKLSPQWLIYLSATLLGICLFVFINATQSLVLTQILHIPSGELGDKAGTLSFIDQIVSLATVYLAGICSDFVGRRVVYSSGFLVMGVAVCGYTFLETYGEVIAARALFAVGGGCASSMVTAVLADYAQDRMRGRMAGLVGLCSGLGALLALFGFMPLPLKFDNVVKGVQITYLIVGGISIVFSGILFAFLSPTSGHPSEERALSYTTDEDLLGDASIVAGRGVSSPDVAEDRQVQAPHPISNPHGMCPVIHQLPNQHEYEHEESSEQQQNQQSVTKKSFFQVAQEGFLAARNPKVLLGYVGSFLARGDTVIITLFIPLWVYKRYIDQGLCIALGGPQDPDIKDECRAAYSRASAISGIAQTAALVGAPLFGYLADRLHATNVVLFNALLGLIAYTIMFLADPLLDYVFAIVILVGLSEIGLVIGNMSLVTNSKSVDASIRGSVAG